MKTRAAVLWDRNKDWSVEEIELDRPKQGEVLVALGGSGLCHSDEHVVTGDLPTAIPVVGGHEGAGIVQEIGPGVTGLAVNQASCVKIDDDLPLDLACLLGCGVITGWGSVVNTGEARVGDVVVVVGVGGIGINAVQGAVAVGAEYVVAVDPVAFKREKALEFGATHAVASNAEAAEVLTELTRGRMANVCVNTMGVGDGDQIGASLALVGKRGRVVVTNIHPASETRVAMSALDLTTFEKQVRGSLFGSSNPRSDIPRMLELHRSGQLKLEELRTRTYSLDEINTGYDDMRDGRNLRGVITF